MGRSARSKRALPMSAANEQSDRTGRHQGRTHTWQDSRMRLFAATCAALVAASCGGTAREGSTPATFIPQPQQRVTTTTASIEAAPSPATTAAPTTPTAPQPTGALAASELPFLRCGLDDGAVQAVDVETGSIRELVIVPYCARSSGEWHAAQINRLRTHLAQFNSGIVWSTNIEFGYSNSLRADEIAASLTTTGLNARTPDVELLGMDTSDGGRVFIEVDGEVRSVTLSSVADNQPTFTIEGAKTWCHTSTQWDASGEWCIVEDYVMPAGAPYEESKYDAAVSQASGDTIYSEYWTSTPGEYYMVANDQMNNRYLGFSTVDRGGQRLEILKLNGERGMVLLGELLGTPYVVSETTQGDVYELFRVLNDAEPEVVATIQGRPRLIAP